MPEPHLLKLDHIKPLKRPRFALQFSTHRVNRVFSEPVFELASGSAVELASGSAEPGFELASGSTELAFESASGSAEPGLELASGSTEPAFKLAPSSSAEPAFELASGSAEPAFKSASSSADPVEDSAALTMVAKGMAGISTPGGLTETPRSLITPVAMS